MDYKVFRGHLVDFLKGLLAAMLTSAIVAGMQYIGQHIPHLVTLASSTLAAYSAIRYT